MIKNGIFIILLFILSACAPTNQEHELMQQMPLGTFVVSKLDDSKKYMVMEYRSGPSGYFAYCKNTTGTQTFRLVELKPVTEQKIDTTTSITESTSTTTTRKQFIGDS